MINKIFHNLKKIESARPVFLAVSKNWQNQIWILSPRHAATGNNNASRGTTHKRAISLGVNRSSWWKFRKNSQRSSESHQCSPSSWRRNDTETADSPSRCRDPTKLNTNNHHASVLWNQSVWTAQWKHWGDLMMYNPRKGIGVGGEG